MKAVAKFLHGVYRTGVKIFLSIGYDFYTWKEEELPCGPKLFVSAFPVLCSRLIPLCAAS